MTARYAICDPRTDRDIGEFSDMPEAYAEVDRLTQFHGKTYSIRIV